MNYYNNTPPEQMYYPPGYVSPLEKKALRHKFNIIGITLICFEVFMNTAVGALYRYFVKERLYNENGVRLITMRDVIAGMLTPAVSAMIVFAVFCLLSRYDPRELFTLKNVRAGEVAKYTLMVLGFQQVSLVTSIILILTMQFAGYYVPSVNLVMDHKPSVYVLNLFITVIAAPIGEELIYRGIVLRCSAKISQRFAIFFSAFIFGIMHGNPYQFILGFLIGLPMAMITVKSGSLIPAIICHITNNFVAAVPTIVRYFSSSASIAATYISIPLFLVPGATVLVYEAASGRIKLPEYTEYHKKRTLPVVFTSWSIIAIMAFYIYSIISSVKPIPEEMREKLFSAAEKALNMLVL